MKAYIQQWLNKDNLKNINLFYCNFSAKIDLFQIRKLGFFFKLEKKCFSQEAELIYKFATLML